MGLPEDPNTASDGSVGPLSKRGSLGLLRCSLSAIDLSPTGTGCSNSPSNGTVPIGGLPVRPFGILPIDMQLDRKSPSLLRSASGADLDAKTLRPATPSMPVPPPASLPTPPRLISSSSAGNLPIASAPLSCTATLATPSAPLAGAATFFPTPPSVSIPPPRLDPPTAPHTLSFGTPISTPDALLDLSKDCLTTPESTHLTSTVHLNALKHKSGRGSMVSRSAHSLDRGMLNIEQSTLDMMHRLKGQLTRLHAKLDSPRQEVSSPLFPTALFTRSGFGDAAPMPRPPSPVRYRIFLALSSIAMCFLSVALPNAASPAAAHIRSRLSRAAVALALSCLVVKPSTAVKFATSLLPVLAISCVSLSNVSTVLAATLSALSYLSVLEDL